MLKPIIYLYAISFILGAAGALLISIYGHRLGLLDKPNERSSHSKEIPKGGGIGILFALIISSFIVEFNQYFLLSTALIAAFSLVGDKIDIAPKFRLPLQFGAAFLFLVPTLLSKSVLPSSIFSPMFFLYIAYSFFIVGTANFYNFMDGINGIAGLTGIITFGLVGIYAFFFGINPPIGKISICIVLACLGFLPFNLLKAIVFLGDVGSILLGFAFAALVVQLSKSFLDFFCLVAFLFPIYADALTTLFVRLIGKKSLFRPHRQHMYQLLANEMGIAHWKVSVGYGILQLIIAGSVLMVRPFGILALLGLLLISFCGFTLVSFRVRNSIAI